MATCASPPLHGPSRRLVAKVALPGYRARIERVALLDVAAFDWNCPQHITQRYTLEQVEEAVAPLHARIDDLERRLAASDGSAVKVSD